MKTRLSAIAVAVCALVGVAAPAATAAPLVPAADHEVDFVVDGTTTFGTLHVPAHRAGATMAAALLIPGSGLTDRNGNVSQLNLTPDTLRLFADLLGTQGIMTYRFDKYGTGRTGFGAVGDPSNLDMPLYTRQAAAAYTTLRAQPGTDPHHMLIVGHSEGGLQALLVARTVRPAPAGLALLAPQDLRILDIIAFQVADQIDAGVSTGAISASDGAATKAGITRVIAEFRAGQPLDTTGMLPNVAAFFVGVLGPLNARFIRSDDAIYPPDVVRDLRPGTRVLLTCGTADVQVPCATVGPEVAALARRHITGPGLRVLPDVTHFLHSAGTPDSDQTLGPVVQHTLLDFARPFTR